MGLAATTSLHKLSCLANELACIQTMAFYHIIAEHDIEHWFIVEDSTYYTYKILRTKLTNLEHEVFGCIR